MIEDPAKVDFIKQDLRERMRNVVDLPARDVAPISSLIDAGEWELALDTLCTQVFEYDLELRPGERSRLQALGRELNVPVSRLLGDP